MHRLTEKTCVVTGAARGIGRAIAEAFHEEGAIVVITDKDDEVGAALATRLGCQFARVDVREEGDWQRVLTQVVAEHGRLDVLVNNAGVSGFEEGVAAHDPENVSLDDWRAVHAVNLDGVFLGCKYGIQAMRPKRQGSIINISSRSGFVGVPGAAAYASSKAAVRNHTKSVALWCAGQGLAIRCNSLHPGAILTPMWEAVLGAGVEREERIAAFVNDIPARRFGRPEEVAAMAVLLGSDEAPFITGAELSIDGGLLAGPAASPG